MTEEKNSIDESIATIDAYVKKNQEEGHRVFSYLRMFSVATIGISVPLFDATLGPIDPPGHS